MSASSRECRLKEAGYVEGRNVASEYRGAEDHYDRLPELATDLLRRHPAVIVALGGPTSTLAAKRASTTVPVVFSIVGDPVALGLVTSFNRPGGNVTGVAGVPGTIVAKQIEALHEMVPTATVIGCLLNPNNPKTESDAREARLHVCSGWNSKSSMLTTKPKSRGLSQLLRKGVPVDWSSSPTDSFISRPDTSSRWPGA